MKLREHFKNHFTSTAIEEDPVELILIPDVIEKLGQVVEKNNTNKMLESLF